MQRITLHQGKGRFHQHFYMQLIHTQIQKAQKRQSSHQCLFALLGSACEKAAKKTFVKSTLTIFTIFVMKKIFVVWQRLNSYHFLFSLKFKRSQSEFETKVNAKVTVLPINKIIRAVEEKEITHIKAKVTRAHTYTHKRTHIHTRTHAHTRAHTRTHFFSLSLSEREIESYQTRNDAIGLFLMQLLDFIYRFLLLWMVYRFGHEL